MTGKILAVIPARGGSKRVPGKNLRAIGGRPLLAHTIIHALRSRSIDGVCVSTDCDRIAEVAQEYGARVVMRPPELANDTASSESATLHALDAIELEDGISFEAVVMLQCTSPVRREADIDNAVSQFLSENADSLVSACPTKHFFWWRQNGQGVPGNYDFENRPRSQDIDPQFQENGSIYITRCSLLRERQCRLGGKISIYEMDLWSSFEIDNEQDFKLVGLIVQSGLSDGEADIRVPARPQLIVFDFDGVMTDNTALVDEDGNEHVRVDRSDGLGIDMLKEGKHRILVLSSEKNPVVQTRCKKLGVECINGVRPKADTLKKYLEDNAIDPAKTIYVGNDANDLDCFEIAGCAIAVGDAHPSVIRAADIVLTRSGGRGAVREVCDLIIRAGGHE